MFAFVPCLPGLLRLCAPRRCQPGVLYDPGTHFSYELVVLPPHQPTWQYHTNRWRLWLWPTTIKKRTALSLSWRSPSMEGTASSHPLGRTNNGLDCNHEKKRGVGVCLGPGGGAFCLGALSQVTPSVLANYVPTTGAPTSLQVFLPPAPAAHFMSRSPSSSSSAGRGICCLLTVNLSVS